MKLNFLLTVTVLVICYSSIFASQTGLKEVELTNRETSDSEELIDEGTIQPLDNSIPKENEQHNSDSNSSLSPLPSSPPNSCVDRALKVFCWTAISATTVMICIIIVELFIGIYSLIVKFAG